MSHNRMGLDLGSTTIKIVITDNNGKILFSKYKRHFSDVKGELKNLFIEVARIYPEMYVDGVITGSGGLSLADALNIPFMQEVVCGARAAEQYIPESDVILELGGEDAKITYLKPNLEQRMNGTCAGGTGAFIDQMASLLNIDAQGLNKYAKLHKHIYPIAARCGVFAKSDIQPLLNEGAAIEDISASIFQSVVNQTLAGLACGRPIRGNVAFLGGPLHFLSELRERFIQTLKLSKHQIITPENSHMFVALGASLMEGGRTVKLRDLPFILQNTKSCTDEICKLPALFKNKQEFDEFSKRHNKKSAQERDIAVCSDSCYLGLDAGSTTIKAVLIDSSCSILYKYYGSNKGNPLEAAIDILKDIYSKLNKPAYIAGACVTGYGEGIIKKALKIDMGEIETVAHCRAARYFNPNVDFIIDIGGQDMKCLRIKEGVIDGIMLNEACSSGCGSFLDAFSGSLGLSIEEFANNALFAEKPVDLGTRCTVFMNSRVKQSQKEGATIGDISAGLSYSVVKNALYKVIKVKNSESLGKNIVVQGGTFKNNAILRAFEQELNKNVTRPDIAELMGAFGCALIAKDIMPASEKSSVITAEEVQNFQYKGKNIRCDKCANKCALTITEFADGGKFISGNRCERGGLENTFYDAPNLYEYKFKRVFDYKPLDIENAPLGEIGIPRVLNMYENYPFWFTLLTKLGFRVVLSDVSSHAMFIEGIESISSDTVCYPAKLVHGHIQNLVGKGVKRILYPCVPYEHKEFTNANNNYNCPIVTSYPEVVKNNMEVLNDSNIDFISFFIALDEPDFLPQKIMKEFSRFGINEETAHKAAEAAYNEREAFKADLRKKGEETIDWLQKNKRTGIVLAGRPYHIDPEINHGIPKLITGFGLAVLTEDSIAHLGNLKRPIRVMDQWSYHTRLYECAAAVANISCLQLVQLNSFGCGLDAITSDQVSEIITAANKIYTLLKIDEINNLGAVKIRLRSLIAALKEKNDSGAAKNMESAIYNRQIFTKEMRQKADIVCPQMAPLQFQFLKQAFEPAGYNFKVLTEVTRKDIEVGLKYVNNDACYPTIIVVGQLVNAFLSGKLDPDNTVIMLTQTGGGCRASNYLAFLRKALKEAGLPQVVVASINFSGLEKNPGFKFTGGLALRLLISFSLGDLLQKVLLATRPYEKHKGDADELFNKWVKKIQDITHNTRYLAYRKAAKEMVADFENIERLDIKKPKVGLVGEILVKYHPDANNHAIDVIESEGAECVLPALMEFLTYSFYSASFRYSEMGKNKLESDLSRFGVNLINWFRKPVQRALKKSKYFTPYPTIQHLSKLASEIISMGNCTGEGWFLTAEMMHLIEEGTPNIICVQPFACLPNHVVGKGMIRAIKNRSKDANVVAIDYDPGASEVNQINRIKLMIYTAFRNLTKQDNFISKNICEDETEPSGDLDRKVI